MREMKRILAMALALALLVGLLPMSVFAAETAETVLDAAIFCSDVHGSTSDLTSVLGGMKNSGVTYSSIGFVGDTCLTVSKTESAVNSGLGYTPKVMFSYAASHDTENSADISTNWNYSGEVEGVSDYYLVYTIRETDMQSDTGADDNFTTWYNGLTDAEKALPIFIMSHRPLHERRNDNAGAAGWYTAISTAAETSDIVVFWAHNHTGESSVDTAAYYVAKDGSETITIEGGSTVTPNFTYMNAGYINANNQSPKRIGVATTVKITASSLIFQDYNSSGEYTGDYAHNVTVEREFASTKTATSIAVTGTTRYTVGGNDLNLTVVATYDDGTTADVTDSTEFAGYDLTKSGTYTVTASYGDITGEIDITVAAYGECLYETTDDFDAAVEVVSTGVTAVTVTNVYGEPDLSESFNDYASYKVELTGYTSGNEIEYTMSIVEGMDLTNFALYHVATDGTNVTLTPIDFTIEGDCIVFTTDLTGTFAYGSITVPDGYTLYSIEASNYTKDWFVGDSLLLTDPFMVTATYKKDGSDDFLRVISAYEENNNPDGYTVDMSSFNMTTAGTYNVKLSYTYGGVTCTTTFPVTVWGKTFTSSDVTVTVGGYGVTSAAVKDASAEANVTAAVGTLLNSGYKAYDITLATAEGYELSGTHTVKVPAPENADVVYYFDETTGALTEMEDATFADGYATFTTDHFSIYIVGDQAEEAKQTLTLGSDETKTVYVLVSIPTAGNQYIIVSSGSAGSGYALKENTTTGTSVTINAAGNGVSAPYIETSDETIMWNAASGMTFQSENGGYYLRQTQSQGSRRLSFSTSQSTSWTVGANTLSYQGNRNSYYVSGGSTWSLNSSTANVYFYEKQTVTVSSKVTYTVTGTDIEHIYTTATDDTETSTITATTNATGGTWSYAVVSDANGIIATGTDSSGNTTYSISDGGVITFSGKEGTALVRVYYTWTVDGTEYKIWTTITVIATAPYYTINLHEAKLTEVSITEFAEGVTYYTFDETTGTYSVATSYVEGTTYYTTPVVQGDEITETVALKSIEAGDTYSVWAVIKLFDGTDENGTDLGDVQDTRILWTVSDTSIATIDTATGLLTFTGNAYGTIKVTAHYLDENGEILCSDEITISVTDSLYIVPEDGTDDFPEYPNEGSIRFDKTAEAVGNFSETGIAKVELSMTGVPYTTGSAIDVLLMIDMSTSMDTSVGTDDEGNSVDRVAVTITAAKAFAKTIVQNEDGTYNSNKIAIKYFNGSTVYTTTDYITVSSDAELEALYTLIEGLYTPTSTGTYYSVAMKNAYDTIIAQDAVSDNTQALVFMSDGGPTYYSYLDGSSVSTISNPSTIVGWFDVDNNDTPDDETDDTATPNSSFKTEYYSYLLKQAGYPVYTVGLGLSSNDTGPSAYTGLTSGAHEAITSYILSSMATSASYFYNVADSDAVANLGNIFSAIAASIKEAATDVVVEDKIDSHYTVNFGLPSGVTSTEAGMSEFYIQVVDYVLDATTHERTGVYTVLENFTFFNSDGTLKSHTVDGAACGDTCSHVTTDTNGVITKIDGTYFDYEVTSDGEYLTWTSEKVSSTELALQYFVYLENSAGTDVADQVEAGTYYTNEYATLTYTNYNGNQVQQEFPVPQMTWKGAQVTYVFYLVNEAGQPVNRAGKVVPFAEAVYVTVPVTYDVTWNDETGVENILAESLFAIANVPSVYQLYDENAAYIIRVYQTENVDSNGTNGNYFQISGSSDKLIDSETDSDTTADNSTTKVFNTKAGTKYDKYGIYSVYDVGTTLTDGTTEITTTIKATDIDYANTTVAFAVVWKPELKEDTVVIDFGLDVVIDVTTNDAMAAGVVGVLADAPSNVTMNSGTYEASKVTSVDLYIDANNDADGLKELLIGTATVESLTSIRFSLDKTNGMQFTDPVVFYYETDVNYYTYDADNNATLNTTSMYSSVTVIPATTVYYEDEYVALKTYTSTGATDADGNTVYSETDGWDTNSVSASATQDQDRPGASQISDDIDADNLYGYDSAYSSMSQFSMGAAAMTSVSAGKYATATFTFYGTGFDIISLTSAATGIITINVYQGATATGTAYVSETVDTYYGYERQYWNVTYTYTDGTWTVTAETQVDTMGTVNSAPENPAENETYTTCEIRWDTTASDNSNALYQVPVMKIGDGKTTGALPYGQYTVVITATYIPFLDHNKTDTGYNFYLDAIRIYNPAGDGVIENDDGTEDTTIRDAYIADGEGWPSYFEVRDQIIDKATFDSLNSETISGVVFIDGGISAPSVSDYTNYGPNNEVYLDAEQAIAFKLTATAAVGDVAKIQLAVKSVGGAGKIEVYGVDDEGNITACLDETISTATDMYYDITKLNGMNVVIKNAALSADTSNNAIISITNVKVTYTAEQTVTEEQFVETASVNVGNNDLETASYSLMSLRSSAPAIYTMATTAEETVENTETETYLFSVSADGVAAVLMSLNVEEEEVEPEEPSEPEIPETPEEPEEPSEPEVPEEEEKPGKPEDHRKPGKGHHGKGHGKYHRKKFDDQPGHDHGRRGH